MQGVAITLVRPILVCRDRTQIIYRRGYERAKTQRGRFLSCSRARRTKTHKKIETSENRLQSRCASATTARKKGKNCYKQTITEKRKQKS